MKQVSPQLVAIWDALTSGEWLTASQIAAQTEAAARTVRAHLTALSNAGEVERTLVFPGYCYRLLPDLESDLRRRIESAATIFTKR